MSCLMVGGRAAGTRRTIVVLVTSVDHILLAGDYEMKVQGMVHFLLKGYEG